MKFFKKEQRDLDILEKRIGKIFAVFAKNNPNPQTELVYSSPFQLLVAVVLSAQTTDIQVNKVTPRLFARFPDAIALAQAQQVEVEMCIGSLGLYRNKAKFIIQLSQQLLQQGFFPRTLEECISLAGVGEKTAKVVMNAVYGAKVIAVDTHIFRVAQRLGFSRAKTPNKMSEELELIIPQEYLQHAHHWLILHGRYVCKARAPFCSTCPVADDCPFVGGAE